MTFDELNERIALIRACSDDPEAAHSREDDLRDDVLKFIASGHCLDPIEYAKRVLRTSEIEFERWCA
jgi:hypothetical protein